MAQRRVKKPSITIVGAGNLGTALALSLHEAGYPVTQVVSRPRAASRRRAQALARKVGAKAVVGGKEAIAAQIVWLCVPDREIRNCALGLSKAGDWRGKIAFHSSGVLASSELRGLKKRGAAVASVHPMMTFVAGVTPSLRGVGFALEGDAAAVRIARQVVSALGGGAVQIAEEDKRLYHAWGTFVSPLFTALLAIGEQIAATAGFSRAQARRWMIPIVRQTLENYARQGAARGVSGPIMRGDAVTVKEHLRVLRGLPKAGEAYRALASAALDTLPARNRRALLSLLR